MLKYKITGFSYYRKYFQNYSHLFLVDIVRGGVQLGPLVTAATNGPIVPAPGDYDDKCRKEINEEEKR
jgi:hypothetical protein